MKEKEYWLYRKSPGARWVAYPFDKGERPRLKKKGELRGPYSSLAEAMLKAWTMTERPGRPLCSPRRQMP